MLTKQIIRGVLAAIAVVFSCYFILTIINGVMAYQKCKNELPFLVNAKTFQYCTFSLPYITLGLILLLIFVAIFWFRKLRSNKK